MIKTPQYILFIKKCCFILCAWFCFIKYATAQEFIIGDSIECYGSEKIYKNRYASPKNNLRLKESQSKFIINYIEVPDEVKIPFQSSVTIWENKLYSIVPINIQVKWEVISSGALAKANTYKFFKNFRNAPLKDVWYPVALAEKIAGKSLNPTDEPDITITLNSDIDWYLGIDGNTQEDSYDLTTIVLHELAHGLGILTSAKGANGNGYLGDDSFFYAYDLLLEDKKKKLLTSYDNPSTELYFQYTNNSLFLNSPTALKANNDLPPKLYAPTTFRVNSNVSHLDEATYKVGSENSLMTPFFDIGESIHQLGDILLGILDDLGWATIKVDVEDYTFIPNPTTGFIKIKTPIGISDLYINLTNLAGVEIKGWRVLETKEDYVTLNLGELLNGVYVLSINNPEVKIKKRIILLK